MSKFCQNCGAALNDNDMFCQNCGTKQTAQAAPAAPATPVAPVAPAAPKKKKTDVAKKAQDIADTVMNAATKFVERAKKDRKFLLIGIGAAVAVLAVIILLGALLFGGSKAYEKPLDNMIAITYKGKFEKIKAMAPKAYWEYREEEDDFDVDEYIEELEDSADEFEDFLESLEDEYGDKVKFKYKVTDTKELSKKKLDVIKEGLKENYDIAKKSVKKAMELEVELTIKGSDDEEETEMDITVAQIGSKWYMVTSVGTLIIPGLTDF